MAGTSSKLKYGEFKDDYGENNDSSEEHSYGDHGDSDEEQKDKGSPDISALALLEKLNLGPKKKLVIFNLNGLLIHRAHFRNDAEIPKNRSPDAKYHTRYVYKRPFLEEFMKFCLERFEVGIWSSAQEHNVDEILDCAFKGLRKKLLFVWDQEHCSDYGFKALEKKSKPLFFKELKKVWQKFGDSKSSTSTTNKKPRFSESNTLLIDDKPYKGLLNPANTGIFPETYDPENLNDDLLDPKKDLGAYLDGLADAEDVPSYVEAHPFGQKPIGPDHKQWSYYSKVIRRING